MNEPATTTSGQNRKDCRRLAALRAYDLIDTPPDPVLDLISRLTAGLLEVPFACVSLVDEHRVFLKSIHGLNARHLGTEPGLCVTAVETNKGFSR
ncbi:MAG: hypothetical protein ACI8TP_002991 [Acidimicrobiales bacterium]|jgi:hypothetical protein